MLPYLQFLMHTLKVEVNLAVLWEGGTDHSYLAVERIQAIESINTILRQLSFWQAADR